LLTDAFPSALRAARQNANVRAHVHSYTDQPIRHDPPRQNRPWVVSAEGRARNIDSTLDCAKRAAGATADPRPRRSE
jgi:hypothetical protein